MPVRSVAKCSHDETLSVRYAELVRLREYVQRLEDARRGTDRRRPIVKHYGSENGRFSRAFVSGGDLFSAKMRPQSGGDEQR